MCSKFSWKRTWEFLPIRNFHISMIISQICSYADPSQLLNYCAKLQYLEKHIPLAKGSIQYKIMYIIVQTVRAHYNRERLEIKLEVFQERKSREFKVYILACFGSCLQVLLSILTHQHQERERAYNPHSNG